MKQLYDTTKKLAGKYSNPERPVKDKVGRVITEIQEQRNRWEEYFEELLNRPASMNPPEIEAAHADLPIYVNPPTTEEIRMDTEATHRSNYKHASSSIQEDLGGETSADGLERRTSHQDSTEK
ncbi:unnamed protein product [Schistosoma mattheei]|uniref:Uncharacterized protein n=1 Tax=Schistosoma mattheei TaxID=31246 RepID=A0A183PXV2_9TREM|nr:unnamed protein product [Schistosoma mattheei]